MMEFKEQIRLFEEKKEEFYTKHNAAEQDLIRLLQSNLISKAYAHLIYRNMDIMNETVDQAIRRIQISNQED